ncbi:MAG: tape measure protein [Mucilaginibacter sp.]|nr:tape measure protein [Mucilaginibacter sp.]
MGNLVEFIVKIKDMASGSVAQLANNAETGFNRMNAGLNRVSSNMNRLRMSISDIDKKLNDLRRTREISVDGRQIRRINQEITDLERRRNRLEGNSGGGMGGMRGLAAGAMAFAGVAGIGSVIGKGMDMQMASKSYEIVAGKQQGVAIFNDLQKYAQDSIYGNEVLDVGKTMLGFGIEADKVGSSVKRLGDIAGGNAERLQRLGLAYSQVKSAGRLMGQDVLQFVNAGFNPLQAISKKTGKSMAVLKKEMEDGKISFNDVAGAIEMATSKGGMFYNMAKQLGETAPGKLMALSGAFDVLQAKAGSSILEMMSPLLDFGNWLINSPNLLMGLVWGIGAVAVAYGAWSAVMGWAAIKAAIFNIVAFWPLLVIMVLVAAIATLIYKYQGWGKAMEALWIITKAAVSNIGIAFKNFFQEVGYRADLFGLKIKETFQFVGGTIGNLMRALMLAGQMKFGEAKQALFAEVKTSATSEITELEKRRGKQVSQNLYDVAQNRSLQGIGVLSKLTERKGKSPADLGMGSITDIKPGGANTPTSLGKTNDGITGGGVKNLTINIGKFQDKTEIHTTNLKQGINEIEDTLAEMFLRIVNSGGAAIAS